MGFQGVDQDPTTRERAFLQDAANCQGFQQEAMDVDRYRRISRIRYQPPIGDLPGQLVADRYLAPDESSSGIILTYPGSNNYLQT